MRAVAALALVLMAVLACGGGASDPVKVAPGVTGAPQASGTPGGYYQDGTGY